MKSSELLESFTNTTKQHISRVQRFLNYEEKALNRRTGNSWTILESLENLNAYFDFYLPEISKQMSSSKSSTKENFQPGMIGDYFAKSMLPKERMRKMKSPKDKNPFGKDLNKNSVETLLKNLNTLLHILETSEKYNLEKVKIKISILKFVKLKLGDALRFIVNHNERHILQAENLI